MQSATTPSRRPTRAVPSPPTRPKVRWALRSARRASSTAAPPSTAEPQVAPVACTIVTPCSRRAARYAATGTASPSSASTTEPRAASFRPPALLLLVGPSIGGRRDGSADHAGHGHERQHVGQRLEQHRPVRRVDGQAEGQRGREAEQERGAEGAERPPVAEDHRGERYEAAAGGDVLVVGI